MLTWILFGAFALIVTVLTIYVVLLVKRTQQLQRRIDFIVSRAGTSFFSRTGNDGKA